MSIVIWTLTTLYTTEGGNLSSSGLQFRIQSQFSSSNVGVCAVLTKPIYLVKFDDVIQPTHTAVYNTEVKTPRMWCTG